MCPPTPIPGRFARETMTAAFHLMYALIRRSTCSSPGNHGSRSGGIVLMNSVLRRPGTPTCCSRARSSRRSITYLARARRLVRVDVGQLGRQPVADDRELLTSGSHGVASPSAVSRAAGRPRERIPRCVVQTNRRTNWPIAHLYLTVTRPPEGSAPRVPPKTWRRDCFATGEPARAPRRTLFRAGRMLPLLYVMRAAVRNQNGVR